MSICIKWIKFYLGTTGWKIPSGSHLMIKYPKMMTLVILKQPFFKDVTGSIHFIELDIYSNSKTCIKLKRFVKSIMFSVSFLGK